VAVMVTAPAPASTVGEEPEGLARLTPIAGELLPQAKIIERKTHDENQRDSEYAAHSSSCSFGTGDPGTLV
jgi:hypothetical protein